MTLYVHIPFCTSRCGYCAFNTFSNKIHLKERYMDALLSDLESSAMRSVEISSIFFGGGTPNVLEMREVDMVMNAIYKNYKVKQGAEITTEANPELIDRLWCKGALQLGINRLSMGAQSFYEDKLIYLEREHSAGSVELAISEVLESGFTNISIDLIYDVPMDSKARLESELERASRLPISHLSAYSLELEGRAPLKRSQESFGHFVKGTLDSLGFTQYEASNFYKSAKCEHNISYWMGEEYIGCGAGAIGRVGDERIYTHRSIERYIKEPSFRRVERLSNENLRLEALFMGLRSEVGVSKALLDSKKADILVDEKMCFEDASRLFSCDYFLGDELALFLA